MKRKEDLLKYLWECQHEKGFISNSDVRKLSEELRISMVELEGVISFYHFFHREPTGKYTIYLNTNIIAEHRGLQAVREAFESATGAKTGSLDPSGTFGLYETSCIGLNDQEPSALINFRPFVNLTPEKVHRIIDSIKAGTRLAEIEDRITNAIQYTPGEKTVLFRPYEMGSAIRHLHDQIPDYDLGLAPGEKKDIFKLYEMGKALQNILDQVPEYILYQIKNSGLSGRGGAFFPTGLKWEFARRANGGGPKYVICNADEGEPGTFKDRVLMATMPGLMIEGMIIGAYVIGASKGLIYLRAEYQYLFDQLETTLDEFREANMLGKDILGVPGFDFDIELKLGAGAYVCGEETALIESLEGKRGIPRTKVYFPVERGYLNRPTIVNNVETFCAVSRILELGSDTYRKLGTERSRGTKLISVSGDCGKPGIYEIEFGMKICDLLELCEAKNTKCIQVSGPSGVLISDKEFDRRICKEDLMCGGSFMIFDQSRCVFDIIRNFAHFFVEESCGICTPCRAGNYLVGKRLQKIAEGDALPREVEELREWSKIIVDASRCGLGKTSTNSILDAMDKFPEVFDKRLSREELIKEFDLEKSIHDYVDFAMQFQEK
jgi:[NiFe] hydrogenase diaphorase moiety large subunit